MNNRTSLGDLTYTWDANKNKTSESIAGVMSGYGFTAAGTTYDFEDRLTGFSRAATSGPALLSQSWNLTAVGDWTSVTTNGTAQNRTHGPTHELLTAGGQNVATDVKGNITTLPANLRPSGSTTAMNLTWDSDNKLRSADIDANGTADVNFQYDALGRRVARTGTGGSEVYVQMDQQTIADYPVGGAATTPTFRYVYGSYIDEPVVRKTAGTGGTLVYFHRNHQYSVNAITTSAGAISERYAYTAYGQPTILNASGTVISATTLSNRYSYTGREWDATLGLHHFRARWMSPSAGRFLRRDPIGYFGSDYGLYEFVRSRPLDRTDPSGHKDIRPWTDPPGIPLAGVCKLRWRCWHIFAYKRHCGLVMSIDGNITTIDGTGGDENHVDWPPQPYLPDGDETITGDWQDVPIATCECLRQRSLEWNKNNVPRHSLKCNSNTTLRCLTLKCNIKLDFGDYGNPYRWDADCKKCVQWKWRTCYLGQYCAKYQSFCDQGFVGAAPDDPTLPGTELPPKR